MLFEKAGSTPGFVGKRSAFHGTPAASPTERFRLIVKLVFHAREITDVGEPVRHHDVAAQPPLVALAHENAAIPPPRTGSRVLNDPALGAVIIAASIFRAQRIQAARKMQRGHASFRIKFQNLRRRAQARTAGTSCEHHRDKHDADRYRKGPAESLGRCRAFWAGRVRHLQNRSALGLFD
jgi:hypothetical protein